LSETRPFALVRSEDQWLRSSHERTTLRREPTEVTLSWEDDREGASETPPELPLAGLAFDSVCRLFHSRPREGEIERILWGALEGMPPGAEGPAPVEVLGAEPGIAGDFSSVAPPAGPLSSPRGIAIDSQDRLYVAEWGKNRVVVYGLERRRLVRIISLAGELAVGPRPLDLASAGDVVYLLTESPIGLYRLAGGEDPVAVDVSSLGLVAPTRVASCPLGKVAILDPGAKKIFVLEEGVAPVELAPASGPSLPAAAHATDLDFVAPEELVVAYWPGEDFFRFSTAKSRIAAAPLRARGYDGLGICRDPKRQITYWTARGPRTASPARVRYEHEGTVVSFRLDGGDWQTEWGRLFVDACIPEGAAVHAAFASADEPPDSGELDRLPPVSFSGEGPKHPELSPPMPPLELVPDEGQYHPLHRRETGRELPWAQPHGGDDIATWECPVFAPPGRYLWVWLKLSGNTRVTPRVRSLRAEHPSHDWLSRLPRLYSRDLVATSFLKRYLAMVEGQLGEIDARAAARAVLLDPWATPDELLPWLASFMGLVLDERFSGAQKRTLISEIACLWRFRGTIQALTRMIEIYLGVAPIIVEAYRLRGPGATVLGADCGPVTGSVVGSTFRVGGAASERSGGPLSAAAVEDAFATHAHRFSVIVPAVMSDEQRDVVTDILETHRPAHTLYELCSTGAGMSIGRALHVGLSTVVGRGGGFSELVLGDAVLGRDVVVGRPGPGTRTGVAALGTGTRVG
jgi:phage tail-like protein